MLAGVILPGSNADPRDPLGELASLAKTAGAKVVGQIVQKRKHVEAATYIGSGKAIEIADLARRKTCGCGASFDNDLSPSQIGELELIINEHIGSPRGEGVKILDRSELILDIFATRAQTHEAKLQVELAQMQYTYRPAGSPSVGPPAWAIASRRAAAGMGIGTRGPGRDTA